MKQHITYEQLKAFPDGKGWLKLLNLTLNTNYDFVDCEYTNGIYLKNTNETFADGYTFKEMAERLTIGKMIEILNSYDKKILIDTEQDAYVVGGADMNTQFNKELCDALWEAVKEVIK